MVSESKEEQPWGRVLLAGGTDWASNGHKSRSDASDTDLLEPHILRSLCHVKVTRIIAGCSANYALAIDNYGTAYMFGKSPASGLASLPKNIIPQDDPVRITPRSVGLPVGSKWVGGAAGRSHVFLLDNQGGVWGCGNNVVGQLGLPIVNEVPMFTKIKGPWLELNAKVIQVTVGLTFSFFLTDSGQVYASGSSENGQLGNGTRGERILKAGKISYAVTSPPKLVKKGLEERKIVQIASGNQHSLALDEDGHVYAWGFAGYARLGLGDQKDKLEPTLVPQFSHSNEIKRAKVVLCGPTNSIVIDRLHMFHMAGKWKLTGDGSTGSPYTTFKQIEGLAGFTILTAAVGGCTHFVTMPSDNDGVTTVGFGQGALYGELGFGPSVGKSSTKPQALEPLLNVDVIQVAAGQYFTLFLAHPNAALSEVPRYPLHVDSEEFCLACHEDRGDADPSLECERCDEGYHPSCLDPPLSSLPEGEWFCPKCEKEAEMGSDTRSTETAGATGKVTLKRTASSRKGSVQREPVTDSPPAKRAKSKAADEQIWVDMPKRKT